MGGVAVYHPGGRMDPRSAGSDDIERDDDGEEGGDRDGRRRRRRRRTLHRRAFLFLVGWFVGRNVEDGSLKNSR